MNDSNRVRLTYAVWDNSGNEWTFSGYNRIDGTEESAAAHERLVLIRVPELVGQASASWDYTYSIRR